MLWPGAKYDGGRVVNIDESDLCGANVNRARKEDAGIWRCNVVIRKSERTFYDESKIQVTVNDIRAPGLKLINSAQNRKTEKPVVVNLMPTENIFFRTL